MSGYISSFVFSRLQLIDTLSSHFRSYQVSIHGNLYRQIQGIPQGSILSVPLCNLYLRAYEQNLLIPSLHQSITSREDKYSKISPSLLVLRFVDDFLFLTHQESVFKLLPEILSCRNPYHLVFKVSVTSSPLPSITSDPPFYSSILTPTVQWCGFILSPNSLNIDSSKSLIFLRTRSHLQVPNRGSFQSVITAIHRFLQPRVQVFRHVGSFPSLLQDIYFCVLLSLRRVIDKQRVKKVSKARLLMMWMIRYLKKYTINHTNNNRSTSHLVSIIQWLVMAAFLKVMRNQPSLRRVHIPILLKCSLRSLSFLQ